jgi:hypothetical protein
MLSLHQRFGRISTLDFYREFGFETWSFSLFLDESSLFT